ncbi:hypothetical protein LIER_20372 [Lithospermum erythrorhizon]|uniref:Uncharacterized protein n=1 Tax=Lithospermum erythrorhizon TaxID=34254 RepID=A0AAV3QPQ3_LITER
MDEVILDSLLYQTSIGQYNGRTFSSLAYTYIQILLLQLRKLMHQQGGSNGKENKRKCKTDAIVEACNEMLTTNVDKLLLPQMSKCLEDMDFDQRYKNNAYIHLYRNRVDYDILTALSLDGRWHVLWNMMVQVISVTKPSPSNSSFI